MALILRTCTVGQKGRYLQEFTAVLRNVTCTRYNQNNVKKFVPAVQVKWFSTSTKEHTKNDQIQEVYNGLLTRPIRNVKLFSLLTSLGAILVQPFIYQKALESDSAAGIASISILFAVSTFLMPIMIHSVTKKYIRHIYYDPKEDKYICKTYTLFLGTKEMKFTPNDVVIPDAPGMFTTCLINGTPLFFDERCFSDSTHYIKIMGYDKPVDFKLGESGDSAKKIASNNREEKVS